MPGIPVEKSSGSTPDPISDEGLGLFALLFPPRSHMAAMFAIEVQVRELLMKILGALA